MSGNKRARKDCHRWVCPSFSCVRDKKRHARQTDVNNCIKKHEENRAKHEERLDAASEDDLAFKRRCEQYYSMVERSNSAKGDQKVAIWAEEVTWWEGKTTPFGEFHEPAPRRRGTGQAEQQDHHASNEFGNEYTFLAVGGGDDQEDWGYDDYGDVDYGHDVPATDADTAADAAAIRASSSGRSSQSRRTEPKENATDWLKRLIVNGTPFTDVIGQMHKKLAGFVQLERFTSVKHGIEQAYQLIDAALQQLESTGSLTKINETLRTGSATKAGGDDGFTVNQLLRRHKVPYETSYSCEAGHDVNDVPGSVCQHPVGPDGSVCGKPRVIASYHFKIEDWIKHLMHNRVFARHVRDGPIELSKASAGGDDAMLSLWTSDSMRILAEQVNLTLLGQIPVVIQLFVDGFEPTESTRSVWAVLARVLNLPGDVANGFVFPICMIDGKSIDAATKPDFIDAQLRVVVEELQRFYTTRSSLEEYKRGDRLQPAYSFEAYDSSKSGCEHVRVYLHSVSCDMKALKYVAKHKEVPSKCVCHLCNAQGVVHKTPGTAQAGKHSTVYTTITGQPGELFAWRLKNDGYARGEFFKAERGLADPATGYLGAPVFADLLYFDCTKGFLICFMHQISNAVTRCMAKTLGLAGWTGEIIKAFFQTDEGKAWRRATQQPYDDSDVPDDIGQDEESLKKLRVDQLKTLLSEARLTVGGRKADMIARLLKHNEAKRTCNAPSENHEGVHEVPTSAAAGAVNAVTPPDDALDAFLNEQQSTERRPEEDIDECIGEDVDDNDINDATGDGNDDAGLDEGPDGDVDGIGAEFVNDSGIQSMLQDPKDAHRSVYSRKWWNGFASMLKWPHVANGVRAAERSIRMAYLFGKSVTPPSFVNGKVVDLLHPCLSKRPGVKSWFRKVKMAENKDHAITMQIPVMMCLGGVSPFIVRAYADFFWGLRVLCDHNLDRREVEAVAERWPSIYQKLERELFPPDRTAALHALYHWPAQVLHLNDSSRTSSFAFESYLGPSKVLAKLNRRRPVQTLMNRFAARMGLSSILNMFGFSVDCESTPTENHLVYDTDGEVAGCIGKDVSTRSVVPSMEAGQGNYLVDFLLRHYESVAGVRQSVTRHICKYEWSAQEFKSLKLPGQVHIQDESSSRKVTNNSLVMLPKPAAPAENAATRAETPDLAEVLRIYRVRVGPTDSPIDTRTLLLVRRYHLHHVDEELEACGLKDRIFVRWLGAKGQLELVDVCDVIDQAFVGSDPRRIDANGRCYEELVFSKRWTRLDQRMVKRPV